MFAHERPHRPLVLFARVPLLFVCLLALAGAGCNDGDDDSPTPTDSGLEPTSSPGDDDATTGDDDATTGDDDATTGDDDATTGDDDASAGGDDDDASTGGGDDDATGHHGDDDDSTVGGGDDDATDHQGDDDATDHQGDDDATDHHGDDDATDHHGDDDATDHHGDDDSTSGGGDDDATDHSGDDDATGGGGDDDDDEFTPTPPPLVDQDGDGSPAGTDCNDKDPATHPGADEVCDGVDNDCDGSSDEDAIDPSTWYADGDSDGYGVAGQTTQACDAPDGYAAAAGDCDDADASIHPDAEDVCDGKDNDCNGQVDENGASTFYEDTDGDGYGVSGSTWVGCNAPDGYASQSGDCQPDDSSSYPGATEVCDGVDNDCDGTVDDNAGASWMADADGDGAGDPDDVVQSCTMPDGYVPADADEDCDDQDPETYPGAWEVCDGVDNDCDDVIDEDAYDASLWYADEDGDTWGDGLSTTEACDPPAGYVGRSGDCDDDDGGTYPGATEYCDGIDNDCDDDIDEDAADAVTWYEDGDGDGYGNPDSTYAACEQPDQYVADATDCNDVKASIHPGASEVCDGVDQDCDGVADDGATDMATWYADNDDDGYGDAGSTSQACTQPSGYVDDNTDCDDQQDGVHPGASEYCNDIDDDCDGVADDNAVDAATWYADADGDGYGDEESTARACTAPEGYVADATDCDDDFASINPGATEECDGIDDDCDGEVDEGGVCPCDTLSNGDKTYLFCSEASWSSALETCESNGYTLVTLNDDAENTWVVDRAYERYNGKWWTGLREVSGEGDWQWVSGEAFSYSNWHSGEPNNSNGNENCMQLGRFGDYTWNDEPCTSAFHFVCEN